MDNTTIRLLRFAQSSDGTFKGQLKTFPLSRAPPFYSASYVWGPQTYSTSMSFHNNTLPVLTSLAPFLETICSHEDFNDKDWWWIDSICINLSDSQERGAQVGIMGDIYRRARRAIVWLGEERESDSDCIAAIPFLHQLWYLRDALEKGEKLKRGLRAQKFKGQWRAVGDLLGRKWWTRVWTLQEFILPPEVKFYCGASSISLSKFKCAMYSIYLITSGQVDQLFPRPAFDSAWNRRRILQWFVEYREMNLISTLAYLGNHQATDPRDRIYSVLGLISFRDRRLIGDPDYTSSTEQIYSNLVRRFWEEYRCLDIICFTHIFNRNAENITPEEREGTLPSWAPDWRAHCMQASPVPLMASQSANEHIGNFRPLDRMKWKAAYDAPGRGLREQTKVRFGDNLKEMWVNGVVLGSIDGLGGLDGCEARCQSRVCKQSGHMLVQAEQEQQENSRARGGDQKGMMEVLEAIARALALDREDKYLRFQAPKHYVSDFLLFCHTYLSGGTLDPLSVAWLNENKGLRFGGRTLVSIVNDIVAAPNDAVFASLPRPKLQPVSNVSSGSDADSFINRFYDTVRKKSRRLMVTKEGHIGMAPCAARRGDVVAILFGCRIPLVLRLVGTREAWKVVGEAYVHGFMNGEVAESVSNGGRSVGTFRLI